MRIVLLGLPGAGKGTQAEKLKNRLNLPHISTGNLLRETVKKETSLSNKIKSFLDRGELVPYSIILRLLREIIKEKEKFILDGFPRNLLQAEELDVILGEENKKLDLGINLKVEEEVVIHRLNGRLTCPQCGKIYHKDKLPSGRICEVCGARLYQREDDDVNTIKRRIKVYKESTRPLIEYYEKKGILYHIQGEKPPEEIFKEIMSLVKNKTKGRKIG